jgi:hypothetical protein
MSPSALGLSTFSAKAGNILNQDGGPAIYSAGVWNFENSSGVSTFTISDAGAATVSTQAGTAGDPSLILQGNNNRERIQVRSYGGGDPVVTLAKIAGTLAAPTATLSGAGLGSFQFGGYDGTTITRSAWLSAAATENWSGSAKGSKLYFSATPDGSTTIQTVGEVTGAGAWTLGPTLFAGTHSIFGTIKQIASSGSSEYHRGTQSWGNVANGAVALSLTVPNNFRGLITVSQWNSVNGNVQTSTTYFVSQMGSVGFAYTVVATRNAGVGMAFTISSSGLNNITITNTSGGSATGNISYDLTAGA